MTSVVSQASHDAMRAAASSPFGATAQLPPLPPAIAPSAALVAADAPSQILDSYSAFAEWTRNSLDSIKPALQELSYALLLQCYVELLLQGDGGGRPRGARPCDIGRALLSRYQQQFETIHGDELATLMLVTDAPSQVFSGAGNDRKAMIATLLASSSAPSLKSGSTSSAAALPSLHAGSGSIDGGLLARLVNPANRHRVVLPPLALQLALEYLLRNGYTFLLGRLNERIAIVVAADQGASEWSAGAAAAETAADVVQGVPLPVTDVVAGIGRATDRTAAQDASSAAALKGGKAAAGAGAAGAADVPGSAGRVVTWGCPFGDGLSAYSGIESSENTVGGAGAGIAIRASTVAPAASSSSPSSAIPMPDYRSSPYGRAILSAAVDDVYASAAPAAATSPSVASDAASAQLPSIRTAVISDGGAQDSILCSALSTAARAGHRSGVQITRTIAAGYVDGVVKVWVNATIALASRSPSSSSSASQSAAVSTSICIQSSAESSAAGGPVLSLAISPCGQYCLSGHADGSVRLWPLQKCISSGINWTIKQMRNAGIDVATAAATADAADNGVGKEGELMDVDGGSSAKAQLASGSNSALEQALREGFVTSAVEIVTPLTVYSGHSGLPVWCLAFCPFASNVFASGGRDGCAYLWSTAHAEPQRVFAGHSGDITSIAFHPNGLYCVTGSSDHTLRLYECASGDCLRLFAGHHARVSCVTVAPSGRFVLSGDDAGQVRLWDVPTAACIVSWAGHGSGAPIHALAFTGDGRAAASASSSAPGGAGDEAGDAAVAEAAAAGPASGQARVCVWSVPAAVAEWEGKTGDGAKAAAASKSASAGTKRRSMAGDASASGAVITGLSGMLHVSGRDAAPVTVHALAYAGTSELVVCGQQQQ